MTNKYLKVNKDLFKLGLDPTEILILAQVMEFNTTTGVCFISDETLANNFGISAKTISRKLDSLENKGFINRETKNAKGKHGKDRKIFVNMSNIEKELSTDKMTIDNSTDNLSIENIKSTDNLSKINGQNDLIKDNRIDKINIKEEKEKEIGSSIENPIVVEKRWLEEKYNQLTATCQVNTYFYQNKFYMFKE